ncbi:MAG: type 3 dihydrofolate reductase [Bacteroidales bacterium]|nr:type 3 dihydrofolate reductase [Bacteroidales bacterium]MCF8326824.1 type 3 dihydrofolate reductase [Bacteroidales bacterium]
MQPKISIIVAIAKNRVIGKDNKMPWHLPADLKHFKKVTYGFPIIMGRKTFESIGKPLPGRKSIIISRQENLSLNFDSVEVVHSFSEAAKAANDYEEAFVIGGSDIYQLALPFTEKIYMTKLDLEVAGDTHFPELDTEKWTLVDEEHHQADAKNPHDYSFLIYERTS